MKILKTNTKVKFSILLLLLQIKGTFSKALNNMYTNIMVYYVFHCEGLVSIAFVETKLFTFYFKKC